MSHDDACNDEVDNDAPATTLSRLEGGGAPAEMITLRFGLSCPHAIDEIEIAVSSLRCENENETIAPAALEIYVAKKWTQAGLGFYRGAPVEVAEMLVKDDRESSPDAYSRRCAHWKSPAHWRHFLRPPKFYRAPDLRLTGNVRTSLEAAQTKEIRLVLRIPPTACAGIFRGEITCSFNEKRETLPLKIEVWPIELIAPSQDLLLWYEGSLGCVLPRRHVCEAVFRAQLRDIFEHGFTSVSLCENQTRLLQKAVDIAHETGFRRNVVLLQPWPNDLQRIDFRGLTPILYLSDEAELRGATHVAAHRANWEKARALGFKTLASSTHQASARRLFADETESFAPDIASYYLPDNRHYFAFRSRFADVQNQTSYYYWFSSMEKPNLHRVLAGVWLWKSRADGIAPFCYQHAPGVPFSPFDDFDGNHDDAPDNKNARPTKDIMTTYPAANGSVPTVQWQGLAEGINDLKYLTTLENALRNAETSGEISSGNACETRALAQQIRQRTDAFLERISLNEIEIRSSSQVEPWRDVLPHEYAAFRLQMAHDILALQRASAHETPCNNISSTRNVIE